MCSNRRVVLLTSPSLYGAIIINALAATPGIDLVGIVLSNRLYKNKGPLSTCVRFVRRCGWRYAWHNVLVANAAWTRLRLSGRPMGLKLVPQKDVRLVNDINNADTVSWLDELAPDCIASFYFNQWIGAEVRSAAKIGCVNMHPSLLPSLRGPDPVFRAMDQGSNSSGITLHRVADEFDAGEILYQEDHGFSRHGSLLETYVSLVEHGASRLAEWLSGRVDSSGSRIEPDPQANTYFGFPTPDDVCRFVNAGKRLGGIRELKRELARID